MKTTDVDFSIINTVNHEMDNLLELVTKAILKGSVSDIEEYMRENPMDSYNSLPYVRMDKIRSIISGRIKVFKDVFILPYKRGSWSGYFLIDDVHKIVISICTAQTSRRQRHRLKNNERKSPPYIPAFCFCLNDGMEASCKQMNLADYYKECGFDTESVFTPEDYRKVIEDISAHRIDFGKGYRYAVVVYEMNGLDLKCVRLEMYDPEMETVLVKSLDCFLKPDFSDLTIPKHSDNNDISNTESVYNLVSVKPDLRSRFDSEPHQEPLIEPKEKGEEQQVD